MSSPENSKPALSKSAPTKSIPAENIRKIIHVDMDAFFASVEQRDNPELRGKPVAVGGKPDGRGVVAAASYEAREFGVKSAMPARTAKRLCPNLIFVSSNFANYRDISTHIRRIFHGYTNIVEPLSLDEAFLDVTEYCLANQCAATTIAQEIKIRIHEELNLTASAGVSYNKFLAKIASDYDKPNGLFVIRPTQSERFVEQLPVRTFHGVGPKTEAKLKAMNIHTGADLKALDITVLQQRFGNYGEYLYNAARAIDHRPVRPHRIRKSIGRERTFAADILAIDVLTAKLHDIAKEVVERLQSHESLAKTITLKVKYADFTQITRAQSLALPTDSFDTIVSLLPNLLARTEAHHRAVRLVGLTGSQLIPKNEDALSSQSAQLTQPASSATGCAIDSTGIAANAPTSTSASVSSSNHSELGNAISHGENDDEDKGENNNENRFVQLPILDL